METTYLIKMPVGNVTMTKNDIELRIIYCRDFRPEMVDMWTAILTAINEGKI